MMYKDKICLDNNMNILHNIMNILHGTVKK